MGWLEAFGTAAVSASALVGAFAIARKRALFGVVGVVAMIAGALLAHQGQLPWVASIAVAPIVGVIILVVLVILFGGG